MTHLNEDTLRTYFDGELSDSDQARAAAHLSTCPACRARLDSVSARSAHVAARLTALAPTPPEAPQAGHLALARFNDRHRKEGIPMLQRLFSPRLRAVWITLTVVAAMAFALTLPPVQAWATSFLGLFRVQQIEVIEIDTTGINALNGDSNLGQAIAELFSDSMTVTKEPGAPVAAASAAEAGQLAGFTVRLPDNGQTPVLTVQNGTAFEFTMDRERAQVLLNEAGFGDTQLPASLDTEPIQVNIPASVTAAYGTCPAAPTSEQEAERMSWRRLRGCTLLVQIPSPSVNAPSDLDINQLAEVGLQFMGMSRAEAAKVSESVDWSTTLVIPIPREAAKIEEVTVDGVSGTLIVRTTDDDGPPHYTLMWVKDGIIYAVSGFDNADSALEMANSMK